MTHGIVQASQLSKVLSSGRRQTVFDFKAKVPIRLTENIVTCIGGKFLSAGLVVLVLWLFRLSCLVSSENLVNKVA